MDTDLDTVATLDQRYDHKNPRNLIPELCRLFYQHGWVTGTGGGVTIKHDGLVYIAPSGVQKERMLPEDLFVCDENGNDVELPPAHKNLQKSQCTPLFFNAYRMRNAGSVVHTHSQHAVMVTLMFEKEFRITHQEMIKGIRIDGTNTNLKYNPLFTVNLFSLAQISVFTYFDPFVQVL